MRRALAFLAAGAIVAISSAARADPPRPDSAAGSAVDPAWADTLLDGIAIEGGRYWVLADSLEAGVARAPMLDEIVQLEIEEISAIAAELLAEGDPEVAVTLLEDALALLAEPGGE